MPRILTQAHVADFRSRLCEVAARLYFDVGHDGFNMRDLAAQLGVSAMTPYRYFRDKNEILAAVRAKSFARLAERLEAASGAPAQRCVMLVESYTAFALEEAAYYRLMFDLAQTADALPDLAEQEARARAAFAAPVTALTGDSGDARALWPSLHGAIALHLAGKLTLEDLNAALSHSVKLMLNIDHVLALQAPPPRARPHGMMARTGMQTTAQIPAMAAAE